MEKEKLFLSYYDSENRVHFMQLPAGFAKVINIYPEKHLRDCIKALKDNGILFD